MRLHIRRRSSVVGKQGAMHATVTCKPRQRKCWHPPLGDTVTIGAGRLDGAVEQVWIITHIMLLQRFVTTNGSDIGRKCLHAIQPFR